MIYTIARQRMPRRRQLVTIAALHHTAGRRARPRRRTRQLIVKLLQADQSPAAVGAFETEV